MKILLLLAGYLSLVIFYLCFSLHLTNVINYFIYTSYSAKHPYVVIKFADLSKLDTYITKVIKSIPLQHINIILVSIYPPGIIMFVSIEPF